MQIAVDSVTGFSVSPNAAIESFFLRFLAKIIIYIYAMKIDVGNAS